MFSFQPSRRTFLGALAGAVAAGSLSPVVAADLTRGFEKTARAFSSGEEINRQHNIWVMEVDLKPMRMIFVDTVDPQTGRPRKDRILYLAYRAVNRPLPGRQDVGDRQPINEIEPPPGPEKFIPEFTLVTYDDPQTQIPTDVDHDIVIPRAVSRINRIERRGDAEPRFLDSVSVVQDLPQPVAPDAELQLAIYGVATWRNVDADADFFKVVMRGFSNGYQTVQGPDGKAITMHKVIVQKFIRRGDRFDPNQSEFLFDGNPQWEYQPDRIIPGEAPADAGTPESVAPETN